MAKLPVSMPQKVLAKEKLPKEVPDYKKDDDKSFEEIMKAYGKVK